MPDIKFLSYNEQKYVKYKILLKQSSFKLKNGKP